MTDIFDGSGGSTILVVSGTSAPLTVPAGGSTIVVSNPLADTVYFKYLVDAETTVAIPTAGTFSPRVKVCTTGVQSFKAIGGSYAFIASGAGGTIAVSIGDGE